MSSQLAIFDYAALPVEDAELCRMVEEGFAIGAELASARDELSGAGRDGEFAPWLRSLDFDKSYAYKLIGLHEKYGNERSVELFHSSLSLTALVAVSASPDDIREDVETSVQQKIEAGEKVTAADVERLKRQLQATEDKAADDKARASRREANSTRTPGALHGLRVTVD